MTNKTEHDYQYAYEVIADQLENFSNEFAGVKLDEDHHRNVIESTKSALQKAQAYDKLVALLNEPSEGMWDGLARSIMMGRDMNCFKADQMRKHLKMSGHEITEQWLKDELKDQAHLSKGTMCVLIFKAMAQQALREVERD